MRVVVDINHPGHVHYFKNFIWEMERKGHNTLISASHKDFALELLEKYSFRYVDLGSYGSSLVKKIINVPIMDIKMYQAVKDFKPDIFLGFSSSRVAHISKITGKPGIIFDDTEHAKWEHRLYLPFAEVVLTPECFHKDLKDKQIRFNAYMELASLHPNHFTPNPAVLTELGLSKDDAFIIVRFVSWGASHDIGQHGIMDKIGLVKELEQYGQVIITSEAELPAELEKYRMNISPEKLHDLLYYATLYIGEGATTASEAAVLGTPSIYVSSLAGTMGNFIELENTYHLIYSYKDEDSACSKAVELLQQPDLKTEWSKRRQSLLEDKIDVTAFMAWFVEHYPESFRMMKEDPSIQNQFRSCDWSEKG